jgi:hypothetical protein
MNKFNCFQSIQVVLREKKGNYELNTSSSSKEISPPFLKTLSASFETLPVDMVLCILELLNMSSRAAVVVTCKYFNSIWESVKKILMHIHYIIPEKIPKKIPKRMVLNWQLLQCFEHAFECILQNLAGNSPEYPTKALLWVHKNRLSGNALKLLRGFVSQYPQTPILFLKGDPISSVSRKLSNLFIKLQSLKCLHISGGYLNKTWPRFFHKFEQLGLIYFIPSTIDNVSTTWNMNTPRTLFIMEFVEIEPVFGNIK